MVTNRITKFHPFYDAYFSPLKHKHQYWFGVLLLARVVLLMTSVSEFIIPQYINLLLLLIFGTLLTFYVTAVQPYKSMSILTLQTSFFANLVILAGFLLVSSLLDKPILQSAAVGVSTGLAFIQFCGIVLYALIVNTQSRCKAGGYNQEDINDFTDGYDRYPARTVKDYEANEPLLNSVRN